MMYGDEDTMLPMEDETGEMGAMDEVESDPAQFGPRLPDDTLYTSEASQMASQVPQATRQQPRPVRRVTTQAHQLAQASEPLRQVQPAPSGLGSLLSGSVSLFGVNVPKAAVAGLGLLALYKLTRKGR